jgi:DNA-directed RNA polymerase sigma subunit (sigma70/sigma32)
MCWIRKEIKACVYSSNFPLSIPNGILSKLIKMKKTDGMENLNDEDLGVELDASKKAVNSIRLLKQVNVVSLDQEQSMQESLKLKNKIFDMTQMMPCEVISRDEAVKIMYETVNELNDMQKDIIMSQCHNEDKISLEELGVKYNLTRERIRQIRDESLHKIYVKMTEKQVEF